MFVQIIEGRVSDADGLRRQLDRWQAEVRPGAEGFLGSTGGLTDDGRAIVVARFESADAAKANSDRAEQSAWWAETEKCFEGAPTFAETTEVESFLTGGSDDAGFVQVMRGSADRARLATLDREMERHSAQWRPDVIGGMRFWTSPSDYTEVVYFTSEADARAGEQKPPPEEFAPYMADFEQMMQGTEFIDLHDPMLISG